MITDVQTRWWECSSYQQRYLKLLVFWLLQKIIKSPPLLFSISYTLCLLDMPLPFPTPGSTPGQWSANMIYIAIAILRFLSDLILQTALHTWWNLMIFVADSHWLFVLWVTSWESIRDFSQISHLLRPARESVADFTFCGRHTQSVLYTVTHGSLHSCMHIRIHMKSWMCVQNAGFEVLRSTHSWHCMLFSNQSWESPGLPSMNS